MPPLSIEPRQYTTTTPRPFFIKISLVIATLFILSSIAVALYLYQAITTPLASFPVGQSITIEDGMSARDVAELFSREGYVTNSLLLYVSLLWWHDPTTIKATTYVFDTPLSPRQLANELTTGHFAHNLLSLTIREGERALTIADTAEQVLPEFDREEFLTLALRAEGRLFPDTYFLPADYTATDLFDLLTATYDERVGKVYFNDATSTHGLSETEVIILASILEREANSPESMKMVSGILHNRLRIGMALQVDASMEYVLDKPLKELTPDDLKIDSPYNTYLYPGLPPTPIGNPGLTAIEAIINPTPSSYYYYITGNDGMFYYAENFDEHRQNIARYLR
jgi:UPF0755 protein